MYDFNLVKKTLDKYLSTVYADDFTEMTHPSEISVDMGGKMVTFRAWNSFKVCGVDIINYQSVIPNKRGEYVNIDIATRNTKRKYKGGYRRIFERSVTNGCSIY